MQKWEVEEQKKRCEQLGRKVERKGGKERWMRQGSEIERWGGGAAECGAVSATRRVKSGRQDGTSRQDSKVVGLE